MAAEENMANGPNRPPLTDSPWFWIHAFATFALVALTVMGPRMLERQAQIERKQQGRQRALESAAGQTPRTALSTPQSTKITLAPLFVIVGAVWIVAWVMLWRRSQRLRAQYSGTSSHRTTS